ncbi:MAG TPA: TetR/AcrR family transcriptional regulator [Planctomycetota bacterium]|nr:TetR/AcrR family transcriptional regulator [Planctomycetota bacterium]
MARVTDTRDRLLEAALQLIWEESLGAASVDAICEKAEVRKGSFYHFFKSKEELVAAALETHFKSARVDFDRIFSPSVSPIDRLKGFFEHMIHKQQLKVDKAGRVVGCPYASVASACSGADKLVRDAVQEILTTWRKYFETALRDGAADGSIPIKDIPGTVDTIFDYIEGAMMAGRIQNSMSPIQKMGRNAFKLLGLEWETTPMTPTKS